MQKQLTFRERQDLKNGAPGATENAHVKLEAVIKDNEDLALKLDEANGKITELTETAEVNTNLLKDQIETLANENSNLIAEIKRLTEKPAVETKTTEAIVEDKDLAAKTPEENPNPKRK